MTADDYERQTHGMLKFLRDVQSATRGERLPLQTQLVPSGSDGGDEHRSPRETLWTKDAVAGASTAIVAPSFKEGR